MAGARPVDCYRLPSRTLPIACVEAGAVRLAFLVHAHAGAECRRSLLEVGAAHTNKQTNKHTHTHTHGPVTFPMNHLTLGFDISGDPKRTVRDRNRASRDETV